ncbi:MULTISPECIES: SDR family NAD(P)-dependent oxidoreductase [Micrococcaceae]|uniref:SDR family NAD(P)-dependent oxidoreductase n=1 Tax=Micrococcaceae TaxID=1268 RepID=UPI0034607413
MTVNHAHPTRTILITGASRGIGKGIVDHFAERGWNVIALSRKPQTHEERPNVRHLAIDVADTESVNRAFDVIAETTPHIDVAANCAGMFQKGEIGALDLAEIEALLNTNITGTLRCMQRELRMMSSGSLIVNFGSVVGGHNALPGLSTYGASKAAVEVITKTVAKEVAPEGIRVNALSLGAIHTDMVYAFGGTTTEIAPEAIPPLGRIGTVNEVASTVEWLASDGGGYATGSIIILDGGVTP